MEGKAVLKNCPMSARKMRLVVNNIRGLEVNQALNVLKYTNKEASVWLHKLLKNAVNNWEQNPENAGASSDQGLIVKEAYANEGGMLKRFRPAPHGRAHRIRKRKTHVTLVVASNTQQNSTETSES